MPRTVRSTTAALVAGSTALALTLIPWGTASSTELDEYVAMGDSYASGNGTGNPDLDYDCYRSSDAYGPLIEGERAGTDLVFVACGGATTADVLADQQYAVTSATDTITLSIGGNDVGFVDLILSCWGHFDESACLDTANKVNKRIETELPAKLDDTHAALKDRAPGAQIVQVGYPRAFGTDISCAQADGITRKERDALNGVSDNLDATISERAAANGIAYIGVIDAFTGHDVCADDPWLVGKYAWDTRDVYHPTKSGHRDGFRPLVRGVIG